MTILFDFFLSEVERSDMRERERETYKRVTKRWNNNVINKNTRFCMQHIQIQLYLIHSKSVLSFHLNENPIHILCIDGFNVTEPLKLYLNLKS